MMMIESLSLRMNAAVAPAAVAAVAAVQKPAMLPRCRLRAAVH
jgi:hypothetical protein